MQASQPDLNSSCGFFNAETILYDGDFNVREISKMKATILKEIYFKAKSLFH